MAKNPYKLAVEIQNRMQRESKQVMTMSWKDFYAEAEIDRLRDERWQDIRTACGDLGIVIGNGKNVVTFCHDVNFAA